VEWSNNRAQSKKNVTHEKLQTKVMFADLEKKSAQIEKLKKQVANGRVKEQETIHGLEVDLEKTEKELQKAEEKLKEKNEQVENLMKQCGGNVVKVMNRYSSGGRGQIKHEGYPVEVRMLVMRLMGCGCSNTEASTHLRVCINFFHPDWKEGLDFEIPLDKFFDDCRRDLSPLNQILAAYKVARCKRIVQLCHDGSSIDAVDTFCVGVVIENDEGPSESVVLAASAVPKGKTTALEFACVVRVFKRGQEKLELVEQALVNNGVDLSEVDWWTDPKGCSLSKMIGGHSCTMNDNANAATALPGLLQEHLKEIAPEYISEWGGKSETEQQDLCSIMDFTCWAHLRCLFGGRGMDKEKAIIKGLLEQVLEGRDSSERIEGDLDSLIRSFQKETSHKYGKYAKGHGTEMQADFFHEKGGEVWFDDGRAGTGGRQDAKLEHALGVLMNLNNSIEWLDTDIKKRGNAGSSILSTSCYVRGTCQVYTAGLRGRGITWDKVHDALRTLCNGVLENWGLRDMARVADQLYEAMKALVENPKLALSKEYEVFPIDKFPTLSQWLEDKQSRKRKSIDGRTSVDVWPLIEEVLYGEHGEGEEYDKITCQFIKVHAEGCIESMEHNCKNWLTAFDGKFSVEKWTDEMEADLRGAYRTNIRLGESLFSQVDRLYRKFVNAYVSTASGVAETVVNNIFGNGEVIKKYKKGEEHKSKKARLSGVGVVSTLPKALLDAIMEVVFGKREYFRSQEQGDRVEQREETRRRKDAQLVEHQKKLSKELEAAVSYFFIRRVQSSTDLTVILKRKDFATPTAKKRLLHNQLRHFTLGHGMSEYDKPFSCSTDASVGTVAELTARLRQILLLRGLASKLSAAPKPKLLKSRELPDLVFETAKKKELQKSSEQAVVDLTEQLMRYNRDYLFPVELKDWALVQPVVWPVELSQFQQKFKRGTKFTIVDEKDGDEECVAFGMEWDETQKDYHLFFCEPGKVDSIEDMKSDDLDYAYFVSTDTNEGLDKWEIVF
jgi:hypothetical protein